jgi:NAD(P)-dependent dehydrogenase (short-subunit alcohol dehydrogenase family)
MHQDLFRLPIVDNRHNITPQTRVKLPLVPLTRGRRETEMPIAFDFTGRVVIITGAARGVGRAMVRQFADAGSFVLAADRDQAGLAETCANLDPTRVTMHLGDISTPDGSAGIVEAAIARFGRLDVCVNNAAVAPHATLLEERVEVWDLVHGVNVRGTFLMTQAAAKAMIAGGRAGRIINFSSGVSKRGSAGAPAYASSRAATEAFSRVAAIELAQFGILVTCVSPGLIDTQPKPLPPRMAEALGRRIPALPLARAGEPEEVGQVVMFLASEASSYMTGTIVEVDGGAGIGSRFEGVTVVDDDSRYDWITGRTAVPGEPSSQH